MAISDTARRVHDEVFPDHVSTLAITDPELVEYFDNFAFDEILAAAPLDGQSTTTSETRRERGLAVQAEIIFGNDRELPIAVVTRLLPFIGYPRTLNALRVIDEHAPITSTERTPS